MKLYVFATKHKAKRVVRTIVTVSLFRVEATEVYDAMCTYPCNLFHLVNRKKRIIFQL